MKTKTKILLDSYIIGFVVKIINFIVIPLGKILKIDHSLNKNFKTIAICKYKGMGSVIQSTALIRTMKENFKDAKIIFVSSKENQDILKLITDIDEIIIIDDKNIIRLLKSIIPFTYKLIKSKIEVFIDLEVYSNFSSLMSVFSLSTNRLGFYINSKHYRLGNYTHMMYYNTRSSISDTYLQFARLLNCKSINYNLYEFQNIEFKSFTNLNFLQNQNYIVINPNASDLRIERRWSRLDYISLIDNIISSFPNLYIVLIGSKNEADYVQYIKNNFLNNENIVCLAGKTSLNELISLLQHSKLLITNDTGPMHLAFSCNIPNISLFGPCAPNQYGKNSSCIAVYRNLYCSPCVHEFVIPPCGGNNMCMKAISVEQVFKLFNNFMNNKDINITQENIIFEVDDKVIGLIDRKISKNLRTLKDDKFLH